ncbi:hypothetical protein CLOM_g22251 [Closterium sp. NIES-68]|nr:hypothetical protein CLOM_g22251 [Closterium sp. NIES-68]GJP80773.1 hypothetical protein CLOP_g10975 [Closterium sp. NIES-67]
MSIPAASPHDTNAAAAAAAAASAAAATTGGAPAAAAAYPTYGGVLVCAHCRGMAWWAYLILSVVCIALIVAVFCVLYRVICSGLRRWRQCKQIQHHQHQEEILRPEQQHHQWDAEQQQQQQQHVWSEEQQDDVVLPVSTAPQGQGPYSSQFGFPVYPPALCSGQPSNQR